MCYIVKGFNALYTRWFKKTLRLCFFSNTRWLDITSKYFPHSTSMDFSPSTTMLRRRDDVLQHILIYMHALWFMLINVCNKTCYECIALIAIIFSLYATEKRDLLHKSILYIRENVHTLFQIYIYITIILIICFRQLHA